MSSVSVDPNARANLTGSLWMVAAMIGFAFEDSFIKAAAGLLPISQIMVIFGLAGAMGFAVMARLQGHRLITPDLWSRPMRWRVFFEVFGRLFYTLAIALAPLSSATVILQTTPIVVVGGAALFLGERVGWRRWLAIGIGLIGVMIIVKPWAATFTALTLFAVFGMLGFAARDLASRAAPKSLSTATLGFYGLLAVAVAGGLYRFFEPTPWVLPDASASAYLAGAILTGIFAYSGLMTAMRTGEISAVAPFRYSRLLIGIAIGVIWFGESITTDMILGSALIVTAGLFLLWRGKRS